MRASCVCLSLALVSSAIGTADARAQIAAPAHAAPSIPLRDCDWPGDEVRPQFRLPDTTASVHNGTDVIKFLRRLGGWRVHVIGGLFPAPNIAAQAGSIDPTITTMAMMGAFRVGNRKIHRDEGFLTRELPLKGPCPATP